MYVGTRIVSEKPRTLYPGDIIEGELAREQVALGNAEEIKEDERESAAPQVRRRLPIEQATAAPGELR